MRKGAGAWRKYITTAADPEIFCNTEVLKGIDLEAGQGEFITLLGASGCGKTTTLRIIAGLELPDAGQVILEGQDITNREPTNGMSIRCSRIMPCFRI